jgi:hypothetical protein
MSFHDHALADIRELLADVIKRGEDVHIEAILVADEHGKHIASLPLVAALPPVIMNSLKDSTKIVPPNRLEDYRRNADGCRRMAENADDADDKASWLKLADAWLQMLPKYETSADLAGWPPPSDEDSKASH